MSDLLDRRLNAYRDDLADQKLASVVSVPAYAEGKPASVKTHFADVHAQPAPTSGLQTQTLCGHTVTVFKTEGEWSWVQQDHDGYVGYVRHKTLSEDLSAPTHMVLAQRTFLYPGPDLQLPRSGYRSMGSKLTVIDTVETRGTRYAVLDDDTCVVERHLIAMGDWQTDPVSVAETFLHTPYLWGGNTGFGIDCSGLIQISNMLCGKSVLRDSDMLSASIGEEIEPDFSALQRGDIVFWKGHCGMMQNEQTLLHANGNTMNVALEPLANAIERIGYLYGQPTIVRRP